MTASNQSRSLTRLDVVAFQGSSNLPLWLGIERGLFVREGLAVTLHATTGAIPQMLDMMAGKYHIAATAMDNIPGFTEGQVEVAVPPGFDVLALAGVHSGSNFVVSRPEIRTFADIRGKTVSVDALQSGYGFVLYRVLEDHGLKLNLDYTAVAVGSGPGRLESMKAGSSVAGLLSAPNDIQARKLGFNVLADTVESLSAYQATTYAARRSWAHRHRREVVGFLRAAIAATDLIFEDKAGAIAVLRKNLASLDQRRAETVYDGLTSGRGGFNRKCKLNMDGVRIVLELRSRYAEPKMAIDNPENYIDLSYYDEAIRSMGE
jgi:ABC-type nitrate/sulfonate/bicarbonate transport system substrate-binding protein